mmetsp:Transcript_79668/g.234363  ORF Transcript_79668/g.234363 Transcript_79668/m.234363 type:complete len:279 (-) Transcript_79668:270-1106(-)
MPTLSAGTPWLSSSLAPASPSARTTSPTSRGASGERGWAAGARARTSRRRLRPSEQRTCTERASRESQTTPRCSSSLPSAPKPLSSHSTRLPGQAKLWVSERSLRLAWGTQRPLLPGKSTAAARPSMARTRPTSPGRTPGGRPGLSAGSAASATKRPGKMPARCRCSLAEDALSSSRSRRSCPSSTSCPEQVSRNLWSSASISASFWRCCSASSDLSFSSCSSFEFNPSRSNLNSSYSFLSIEQYSASPEVTPTRRIFCRFGFRCLGLSCRMYVKSTL